MKPIKQTLLSGAMILALSLVFTSCDDILGEWDRPAPNPVVPTTEPEPEQELPGLMVGKFSVSDTKKVIFSPGNLQYNSSEATYKWRFAEHQYDYVGAWNTSTWVDLFGWGTWTGDATNPINESNNNGDYSWAVADFTQESKLADESQRGYDWRTLTDDNNDGEWSYLLKTRTTGGTVFGTASARYAHATINTDGTPVNGLILFPDGVDIASSEVTTAGLVNHPSDWGTKCTSAQWTALAAKGCVFLPAAGYREGTTVNEANKGYYWSSSPSSSFSSDACNVDFGSYSISWNGTYRRRGHSVRLVRDVVD